MLESPVVVQSEPVHMALIHLRVPSAQIMEVMGPTIREVFAEVAAQGMTPAGPWFTHHATRPGEFFDFDACVPVAKPIKPAGRVVPGKLPVTRVARAVYVGGYEGLGAGWGEFLSWVSAQGYKPRPDLWECYVVGPESGADTSTWRTQLNQPLLD